MKSVMTRCGLLLLISVLWRMAGPGGAVPAADNLLPNGGFEKDANGDGVADGWIAQPFSFSRQTLAEVQAYIANLPPYQELLKGDRIVAADGTPLWTRKADGTWDASLFGLGSTNWGEYERSWRREINWYERTKSEALPQNSRFGELPLPGDLNIGDCTLVLSSKRPHQQVISEPVPVNPDTGYRLTFWVRTSGGGEYWWGPQVLEGACDPEKVPSSPQPGDHYNNPDVLNSLPAAYWWCSGIAGRYWARMEIPFRTGPNCRSIRIRLPYNHREEADRQKMNNENCRIWYDDLRLIEDRSVRGAGPMDESADDNPEPEWPADAKTRGFVTTPRPTLPTTYDSYRPKAEEVDTPIRLTLAAGETDSAVLFVRGLLKEELVLRAEPSELASKNGYGLQGAYGARFITIRAAEMAHRFLTAKRYVYTPKYLLNSSDLSVRVGGSGQFWITVTVPPGTPDGEYVGKVTVTRIKPAGGEVTSRQVSVPFVLTVRDFELEEADAAFFAWGDTAPVEGTTGPPNGLPGAEEIYLADQRRHGMNTVATYCYAERKDQDGKFHVCFNELDALADYVRRAGLCRKQPLLLYTWRDGGVGGEFGEFAGGKNTVMAIAEHAKKAGWPSLLFGVLDEPNSDKGSARVAEVIKNQYADPRKKGVRTVAAGGYPGAFTRPLNEKGDTVGDLYDVWIEGHYGDRWPETHKAAKEHHAELWMYNCWLTGAGYLQERFYAGLWTWRTGVKGNGVWSYGWYVRINDSGMPEAKVAWEGRMAGVNDYRYLQTLEHVIAAAARKPRAASAVENARRYLDQLRERIPLTTYRQRPGAIPQNQWAELDAWNPAPEIRPEDYDHIREECARYIVTIRQACLQRKGDRE